MRRLPAVHPEVAESGWYAILPLHRVKLGGQLFTPARLLKVGPDRLKVAAHLVAAGRAVPADERTRLDVALFEALQRSMGPPGGR